MDHHEAVRAVFDHHAAAYRDRYMDVSPYAAALADWVEAIPPDARVLDVACGPGNLRRFALSRRPTLRLTGVDLAPRMIALARAANPSAHFLVGDARRACAPAAHWDAILCGGCLPYLAAGDANALIAAMHRALVPGGLLYLSALSSPHTHTVVHPSSDRDVPSIEVRYHASDDLRERVRAAGFDLLACPEVDGAAEPGETQLIARRPGPA